MKNVKKKLAAIAVVLMISCGGISNQSANSEGFGIIEDEIKSKFGIDAYYTDLKVIYIKGIGNTVSTTVTGEPEFLKMGEWNLAKNTWTQRSEITLEVPEGTQAKDFMFQLNDNISLTTLGKLVEKSITHLKEEKNLDNPILSIADISFSFYYKLNGELIEID